MASGNWTFSTANKYITGRIRWTATSNGDLKNSSTVKLYLDYKKSSSSSEETNGPYIGTFYCDGQTRSISLSSSVFWLKCNSTWKNYASATFTVKHTSAGTKTCTLGLKNGGCTNGNSISTKITSTKSVTFDKITTTAPTIGTDFGWIKQSSLNVLWTTNTLTHKVEYSINGGSYVTLASSTTTQSSNFTLIDLIPGTTYSITVRITRTDTGQSSVLTKTATTTATAMISNTPDLTFDIGDSSSDIALTLTDVDKGNIDIVLTMINDSGESTQLYSYSGEMTTDGTTSTTLSLALTDETIMDTIFKNCTTRKSAELTLISTSSVTDSENLYTSEYTGVVTIPESYAPTFGGFSYGNADTKTNAVLGNTSYIPQGLGNMQIQISTSNMATGQKYATVLNYVLGVYDSSGNLAESMVNLSYSSSDEVKYDIGTTNTPGAYTISIYALDSRGYTSQVYSKTFYVLSYSSPVVNLNDLTLSRYNNFEKELMLTFKGKYSDLMVNGIKKNTTFTITYSATNITESVATIADTLSGSVTALSSSDDTTNAVTTVTYVSNNGDGFLYNGNPSDDSIVTIESSETWQFTFTISDSFSTITRTLTVNQGIPIMAVMDNGMVGVNKVPDVEDEDANLQVGGDITLTDTDGTVIKLLEFLNKVLGEEIAYYKANKTTT